MKNINRIPIISDKQFECPFEKPYGYIYKITNQINGHYYIGKHKFNKPYLDKKYKGSGSLLKKSYEKYGFDNFEIAILEWTDRDNNELNKLEKLYITVFHANELPNYNLTDGGDGVSPETVMGKKNPMYGDHRFAGENNYFYGKHFCGEQNPNFNGKSVTKYQREFMSKIMTGREPPNKGIPMSEERLEVHKTAMAKLSKDPNWIESQKIGCKKRSSNGTWLKSIRAFNETKKRPIVQLTKDGEFIAQYACAGDAVKAIRKKDKNNINHSCRGYNKYAYGFKWMYLEDYKKLVEE